MVSANFYLAMKYIFSNILLFLSALFLTACGDSNDEPGKGGGDFLVGKTELAYSREGGSQEINVRSSVAVSYTHNRAHETKANSERRLMV